MMTRHTLLTAICCFAIAASATAQRAPLTGRDTVAPPMRDTTTRYYAPKDPFVAGVLSFFLPGVGHAYAGRPGKFFAYFALTAGTVALALNDANKHHQQVTFMVIVPLTIRLVDIVSSADDARRWNATRSGRPMPRIPF